jgi:hypothetical protein
MAIDSYAGIDGLAINVEDTQEVFSAIDAIHAQIMDNFSDRDKDKEKLLSLLSKVLDKLSKDFDVYPQ